GSFLAVAYINNTGEGPAHDVTATLSLPVGFKLAGGHAMTRTVGDLEPGETAQVSWQVIAGWGAVGGGNLGVNVTATNADSNKVSRRVEVLAPPRLLARISHLEALQVRDERIYPWPVRLTVRVENTGGSPAHWSRVQLDTVGGFEIVGGGVRELLIGTLEPSRPQDFSWILGGHPAAGTHTILVSASAEDASSSRASASIQVPDIRPRVWAKPGKSRVMPGDIFSVDVMITNVPDLKSAKFDLRYDDDLVDLAMVSRGALFAVEGVLMPWNEGDLRSAPGRVFGTWGALDSPDYAWGSAATFYFQAKKMGDALFSIENLVLTNESGRVISLESVPTPCTVQITRQ
ncbi:MAG: NEW3 domain-containing protein, partial [Firmicutes bacterium]|nr:NEW3 domain-containing protein [Bacillota bacterium]